MQIKTSPGKRCLGQSPGMFQELLLVVWTTLTPSRHGVMRDHHTQGAADPGSSPKLGVLNGVHLSQGHGQLPTRLNSSPCWLS